MLAEYAIMLILSLLAVFLFLGGGHTPLPNIGSLHLANWTTPSSVQSMWHVFWLFSKTVVLIFCHIWIRWSYPRLRTEQLMRFAWIIMIPAGIVLVYLTGLWRLFL